MHRALKAISLGSVTALLGTMMYFLFAGFELEENLGLDVLFGLRGKIVAPAESVIVAIDKVSSDHFGLPNHPAKWPRQLHAQLIDKLRAGGAKAIVIDIFFKEDRGAEQDRALAAAIRRAGNVILFAHLQRDILSEQGTLPSHEDMSQTINIERLVPPTRVIAEAPLALAPFALLKYPHKVTKFWTFRVPAGEVPNLPALALQLYTLQDYPALRQAIAERLPESAQALPATPEDLLADGELRRVVSALRYLFNTRPELGPALISPSDSGLQALLNMYSGPNQHYLNFYGPPRTVTTIPYYKFIDPDSAGVPDLTNKVVFVGFSEFLQPEQKDNFYTVFSQSNGLDLSGVEIAATAFSNLLHHQGIRPLTPLNFIALILLYGFVIASLSRALPTVPAVVSALAMAGAYAAICYVVFRDHYLWLPWVVPLLIQTPFALFVAILWQYLETRREREQIREAFGFYLPKSVVNKIARNAGHIEAKQQQMYGICLTSDAEQYTRMAEQIPPEQLSVLINNYYKLLFEPVRRHNGIISDVVGDEMLAIWSAPQSDVVLRSEACAAALEIVSLMNGPVTADRPAHVLPTRIGLHAGEIMLGNVGAMDHFEYRAVGDIVNTSNRIEHLNKRLGTYLIASAPVIQGVKGIAMRELGHFRLAGKTRAIHLFELLCREEDLDAASKQHCDRFAQALLAWKNRQWDEAMELFGDMSRQITTDKAAQFYLQYCKKYKHNPPPAEWDGVITLDKK
ncbi:CHASE2 domain-containing protein [Sulfuriflexus mobilis]|uniref:CHASE2 domain-containing protein n=1 Tax=Sulfuriflexus mobilis TaxID=1811807 RepID=UPI000F827243|nr:adenylate/guanylate cyclase domain-containing protein [Sulfuriflexus mobilis]